MYLKNPGAGPGYIKIKSNPKKGVNTRLKKFD